MAHLLKFTKVNVSGYPEIVAVNVDKIEHIDEVEHTDDKGKVIKQLCIFHLPNHKLRVLGSLDDVLTAIKCGKDFVYD